VQISSCHVSREIGEGVPRWFVADTLLESDNKLPEMDDVIWGSRAEPIPAVSFLNLLHVNLMVTMRQCEAIGPAFPEALVEG
jgi:hypothetical protein